MRIRLLASSLALSALAVAPACGGEDPPGSLTIPFVIGADVACSTLGVVEVKVDLVTAAGETIDSETVACDDGQAEFMGVPTGNYEVQVTGTDVEKVIVVDNLGKMPPDKAEVTSGTQNVLDDITLRPTPAKVLVRWQLNDGFGQCTDVPVVEFEVKTYEKKGSSPLLPYVFDCDPEAAPEGGYNVVVDPDRAIAGDDLDTILIDPVDAMGNSLVADPLRFEMTPPGLGRTVKLTALVNCTADPCVISCAPGKSADPMNPLMCLAD
jgi:hypothetical protein